jgi:hypothetical protein
MLNRTTMPSVGGSIAGPDAAHAGAQARPRFRALVHSALRACLLPCLGARPRGSHDVERRHVCRVPGTLNWNKRRAAETLPISRETRHRTPSEFCLVAKERA